MTLSRKKSIKEPETFNSSTKELADDFNAKQVTKTKTKIATDMSNLVEKVYLINMLFSFGITVLVGFKFFGFTLDPITYVVSIISSISFTSITTLIVKLLNK